MDLVLGESLLPGSQINLLLLCPYKAEGTRELSEVSLIRALISVMYLYPQDPITYLPKSSPPSTITLETIHMNLGGTQHINLGENKHSVQNSRVGLVRRDSGEQVECGVLEVESRLSGRNGQ